MTLTREQVIEMAKQAGLSIECHNAIDGDEVVQEGYFKYITDEIERLAAIAYSAGRLKGLEEAAEVCEHATGTPGDCAASIDQLKEQTP